MNTEQDQYDEKTGGSHGDAVDKKGDSIESDLDDVFFPVTVVHKTIPKVNVEDPSNQDNKQFVDENAITRCFSLSVSAHIQRNKVPIYEIFPSNSKTNDSLK